MLKKTSVYNILLNLFLLSFTVNITAQPGTESQRHDNDTSDIASGASIHSLFAGAGYGSNMIYLGSTISQNQPFEYGSFAYSLRSSFTASLSAVHLNGMKPFGAFYIGSLGYNHVFNDWFDISGGVYRYQVSKSLNDTLFNNFTYADLTFGIDWKLLYSKISVGGLFSEEDKAYYQFRNSRYFQTPDFFRGKANISFDPYINTLFGSIIKIVSSTGTQYTYSTPGHKWKNKDRGSVLTSYSKKLGLMEVDFGVPVALNTDNMTLEAETDYILPVYNSEDYPRPKGFVFMLTLFFRIF